MHHAHYRMATPPPADVVVRWTARFWSMATIGFVIAFIIGEGINPSSPHEWIGLVFFPLGISVGMIVAWRYEGTGGSITVVSLLIFYMISLVGTGHLPAGWGFPLFAAPGFLFLLAWALSPPAAKG